PVYIDKGKEKEYQQYFIPLSDEGYKLCKLNGGENYNKKVTTTDKKITYELQVGFIVINYLHNNKEQK
ncbi:hypothetical protein, partial [Treponema putidum]|uniref:hypothetical protein n=1 Tax=Treponema putidum TaxID=221027 RepID=UPI003D90224A